MGTPKQRLNWGGNQEAQRQADAAFSRLRNKKGKKTKRPKSKPAKNKKPFVDYRVYIKSAAWFKRRGEALARAGFRCERCQSTRNLHAHHKTYARLGNERPEDLEVLCKDCHADHHLSDVLGRLG